MFMPNAYVMMWLFDTNIKIITKTKSNKINTIKIRVN